jgi:hypothetical protein
VVPSFGASGSAEIDEKNYYTKTKQKANKTDKKISMDLKQLNIKKTNMHGI